MGAMLHWLSDVAHQYAEHEIIVVTNAQVDLPHGWTERDRARTTNERAKISETRPTMPARDQQRQSLQPIERCRPDPTASQ